MGAAASCLVDNSKGLKREQAPALQRNERFQMKRVGGQSVYASTNLFEISSIQVQAEIGS
jgi:hypothetical protein